MNTNEPAQQNEHVHTPEKDSNLCKVCRKPIHNFGRKSDPTMQKNLKSAAKRLDYAAKQIGIATIMLILGTLTFPLGIILWVIGLGAFVAAFAGED